MDKIFVAPPSSDERDFNRMTWGQPTARVSGWSLAVLTRSKDGRNYSSAGLVIDEPSVYCARRRGQEFIGEGPSFTIALATPFSLRVVGLD